MIKLRKLVTGTTDLETRMRKYLAKLVMAATQWHPCMQLMATEDGDEVGEALCTSKEQGSSRPRHSQTDFRRLFLWREDSASRDGDDKDYTCKKGWHHKQFLTLQATMEVIKGVFLALGLEKEKAIVGLDWEAKLVVSVAKGWAQGG